MTQKEQALDLVNGLRQEISLDLVEALEDVVSKAQNSKEFGGQSDGSILKAEWYTLRHLATNARNYIKTLHNCYNCLK